MPKHRCDLAFTRVDAVVIVLTALVIVSAALAWLHLSRIQAERAPCLGNLRQIGTALTLYAAENQERLPYAGLRVKKGIHWTWDDLLNKQLGGNFSKHDLEIPVPKTDMPVLRCPADRVPPNREFAGVGHRRTYAMPAHNMADENWPPGPKNRTCIGIRWNLGPDATIPADANKWEYPSKGSALAEAPRQKAFTTGMIPSPSKTIALTELLHQDNIIGHYNWAAISNAVIQMKSVRGQPEPYHHGKFSYLFLDGHAESLDPLKTLGSRNRNPEVQSGMWIVNQGER